MKVFLVSHTHWDREWYRTFQSFRARLVDAIDRVLELVAADEGYRFLLDGQTIAVEDYLAVRPERRDALAVACRQGRIAIGPWYVQPDSLLPSGEAHVRNLLEGRRVGAALGPVSTVAYTPDSFGHPAQFPQLSTASRWGRSSTGAATATRSTRCPPSTSGRHPTAARCSRTISARATSPPPGCPRTRTRRRRSSPSWCSASARVRAAARCW